MNSKVDEIIAHGCGRCSLSNTPNCKMIKWTKVLSLLRNILLECNLTEEVKWGQPTYTFQNSNIALIHGFKEYCAIMFFKGALLKDTNKILVQQTENVQSTRQIRFTDFNQINKLADIIKTYIFEAIEIEKAGFKIEYKKTEEFKIPEELLNKFKQIEEFKSSFYKLTPGRQRGYLLYFAAAKQSKTREERIEKYFQKIMEAKGLND